MSTQTVHASASGSLQVKERNANVKLFGINVIVVTATAIINLRDGGASGTIRACIPIAAAVGTVYDFSEPIFFSDGLYLDFNGGSGTVGLRWA